MSLNPLDVDFSGSCDATGGASLTKIPSAAYHCVIRVVAQASGNPNWIVSVNGVAVEFGNGPQLSVGPFLLLPHDQITVQVITAAPASSVSGKLIGLRADTAQEALDAYRPAPNTISVKASQTPLVIGTIQTTGTGIPVTKNFPVPPGTLGVGWQVQFIGFGNPQLIKIVGHQTGKVYVQDGPITTTPADLEVAILSAPDTSIDCSVTDSGVQGDLVFFLAFPQLPIVFVASAPGRVVQVTSNINDIGGAITPAPWQAAQSSVEIGDVLGAGGTATKIAGVAGQRIYVHLIACGFDVAASADLQILDGGGAGTPVGRISSASVAGQAQNWKGRPLTAGNGLTIKADGAALTPRGVICYTQAP